MKLKHPDSPLTVETTHDKAEAYLSQGWVEVKAKKPADPKPADK
jgi:hypothetical protein